MCPCISFIQVDTQACSPSLPCLFCTHTLELKNMMRFTPGPSAGLRFALRFFASRQALRLPTAPSGAPRSTWPRRTAWGAPRWRWPARSLRLHGSDFSRERSLGCAVWSSCFFGGRGRLQLRGFRGVGVCGSAQQHTSERSSHAIDPVRRIGLPTKAYFGCLPKLASCW